jgi:long-chain fatty acid transport protein
MRARTTVTCFVAALYISTSAMAGGFQISAQSARAMGMGLAYTGVADDASGIFYNPAGLAFMDGSDFIIGGMVARGMDGTFQNGSVTANQVSSDVLLPELYAAGGFHGFKVGLGAYTPFGLPLRWENPTTFSGRYVSTASDLRTLNLNPTIAFRSGAFAFGVGADYMASKIQLERFYPVQAAPANLGRAKVASKLSDNHGWGWNAGAMWRGSIVRIGVAYRSGIDIDHDTHTTLTHLVTPLPPTVPQGTFPVTLAVDYPSTLNAGVAFKLGAATTLAFDADRTNWSSLEHLDIVFPTAPPLTSLRATNWEDSWAWRAGVETGCGPVQCRFGYYRDATPQPDEDIGPILADADRQAYTAGIGIKHGHFGLDIADVYIRFDDRATTSVNTDHLPGTYARSANEFAVNFHWTP